jgi:putative SOS response-associated peptidase YedK
MCGRYVRAREKVELADLFTATVAGEIPKASWNIPPTTTQPIVASLDGGRALTPAYWSLLTSRAKELKPPFDSKNAKTENAMTSERGPYPSAWAKYVPRQRCLIPADGYYEWVGPKGAKTPFYMHPVDESVLAFAGLYSWWSDGARDVLTFTIFTMPAVDELAPIHDRNPVALPKDWWDRWLDPSVKGDQALVDAAAAASRPLMSALDFYPVAPLRGDGPELTVPAAS